MPGDGVRARVAALVAEAERVLWSLPSRFARLLDPAVCRDDVCASMYAQMALIYARLGEVRQAEATVKTAARLAMEPRFPYDAPSERIVDLLLVVETYARLGRVWKARWYRGQAGGLVHLVESPDSHRRAEAMVVLAKVRDGARCRSERRARAIAEPGERVEALLSIAEARPADAARLVDEALRAARSITELAARAETLIAVARVMARHGRYDESCRVIEEAQTVAADVEPRSRPFLYSRLAIAFARAGQAALALSLARRAEELTTGLDDQRRPAAVAAVVEAYTHSGAPDVAERRALALTNSDDRGWALSQLAVALAPVDLDGAKRIMGAIDNEEMNSRAMRYLRMNTLLRVAEAVLDDASDQSVCRGAAGPVVRDGRPAGCRRHEQHGPTRR